MISGIPDIMFCFFLKKINIITVNIVVKKYWVLIGLKNNSVTILVRLHLIIQGDYIQKKRKLKFLKQCNGISLNSKEYIKISNPYNETIMQYFPIKGKHIIV